MLLKISDQKNKKHNCFLYDSVDVMLRIIKKAKNKIQVADFQKNTKINCFLWLLGDSLETGGEDKSFSQIRKNEKTKIVLFVCF